MKKETIWLVTFGARYAREGHPVSKLIHPDGVVAVRAKDEEDARAAAFDFFGNHWSMVRPISGNFKEFFPKGIIGEVDRRNRVVVLYGEKRL